MKDAEWIADLLQHGLLRPSFIPPAPQRELRELTRYRSSLIADRARVINRLQKVLEDTNLKLASVVTDVTGVSARAILRAYLSGEETDPWELANLARESLCGKQIQLAQTMVGTVKDHHRFLLLQQMTFDHCFPQQAIFPFAFRLQVGWVIQVPPSEYILVAPGIQSSATRRTRKLSPGAE